MRCLLSHDLRRTQIINVLTRDRIFFLHHSLSCENKTTWLASREENTNHGARWVDYNQAILKLDHVHIISNICRTSRVPKLRNIITGRVTHFQNASTESWFEIRHKLLSWAHFSNVSLQNSVAHSKNDILYFGERPKTISWHDFTQNSTVFPTTSRKLISRGFSLDLGLWINHSHRLKVRGIFLPLSKAISFKRNPRVSL